MKFFGIQRDDVRRFERQTHHSRVTAGGGVQELLCRREALERRPVPDHSEPADQVSEELEGVQAADQAPEELEVCSPLNDC